MPREPRIKIECTGCNIFITNMKIIGWVIVTGCVGYILTTLGVPEGVFTAVVLSFGVFLANFENY